MSRKRVIQPPCAVENCELPQYAKTFCRPHYSRTLRGVSPENFKPVRPNTVRRKIPSDQIPRNAQGQKLCLACGEYKDEGEYTYDSRRADLKCLYCKPCKRSKTADQRYTMYGITKEKFDALMTEQQGLCPICLRDITGRTAHDKDMANVDHDHNCCSGATACGECVRGLLCLACNMGLGNLKDSAANIQRALSYISR